MGNIISGGVEVIFNMEINICIKLKNVLYIDDIEYNLSYFLENIFKYLDIRSASLFPDCIAPSIVP